jgi:ABC-type Fe3+/spermidine/putrescine transport system ATPase subunit
MENYVHLHGISRRFGSITAVDRVDLRVSRGELVSLVGPSGAGKTTLLKILAGLDEPTEGWVERRSAITREHPAILVFQDYLLFPHLSVFENVAFGLRSRRRRSRLTRPAIRSGSRTTSTTSESPTRRRRGRGNSRVDRSSVSPWRAPS